jgi:hypothetical protein
MRMPVKGFKDVVAVFARQGYQITPLREIRRPS